ncbi:MAG: 2-amino-4-hydroxy-6-hydroxymethyldihydropteridine diphosphokinase, partial [Henriciella sp.]
EDLLALCKRMEVDMGRVPAKRWGPRVIDVDVLWVEGEVRESDALALPHPRMLDRAFVLVPLDEIAPDLVVSGKTVVEHLAGLPEEDRRSAVPMV